MNSTTSEKRKSMTYSGPSMNPILKDGDELYVAPYGERKVRPGDVIVFVPPGGRSKVVHRVTRSGSEGIRTRGDNNDRVDPWLLRPDHILGRVLYAKRGNVRRSVFEGSTGRLYGLAVRAIHLVDSCVSYPLRPVYLRLCRTDIFRGWLPPQMKTRVVSYRRPSGTELQILIGRRVIGRKLPGQVQWRIRRPFRLFVDETPLSKMSVDPGQWSVADPGSEGM